MLKEYEEKYGETPNQFAADAYDAVYVVKAAIEKSGATPEDGTSAICDKLVSAMTQITLDGLTGDGMTWSASGESQQSSQGYEDCKRRIFPDSVIKSK